MKFELEALVYGLLVPAAVATLILLLVPRLGRPGSPAAERAAGALALAGGFIAGWLLLPWAPLRPEDPWQWLPYLTALACLGGIADAATRVAPLIRWLVRLAIVGTAAWFVVPDWEAFLSIRPRWVAGTAAGMLVIWVVHDGSARRPGFVVPAAWALVSLALAGWLGSLISVKFAQLAGMLAAVLASCAGAAWRRPAACYHRGMSAGVAVVLGGLLVNGYLNWLDSE